MPVIDAKDRIEATLSADAMSASLVVAPDADPASVTGEACAQRLSDAGMQLNEAIREQIDRFIAGRASRADAPGTLAIAGQAPTAGEDGWFAWEPACDPALVQERGHTEDDRVDFYERGRFISVARGQVIGRLHEPTEGEPGVDLRGEAIAATPGQPCPLSFDAGSIATDPEGVCRSLTDGVIHAGGEQVTIDPHLEIHGSVDFDTGNIDFKGDVSILQGVRDRFAVRADGCVSIFQLVEAAQVEAGRDLLLAGGMAGKERGRIGVGGDVVARYLDGVIGDVAGDVRVEREVIQCQLTVGGQMHLERGVIIGGLNRVAGAVRIVELGSRAHLETVLILATVPRVEDMIARVDEHLPRLRAQRDAVAADLTRLRDMRSRGPADPARLAEVQRTAPQIASRIEVVERQANQLREHYEARRSTDLIAERAVHAGAVIEVDHHRIAFIDSIHARVRLAWHAGRRLMITIGDRTPSPIARCPAVRITQARREPEQAAA